MEEIMSLKVLNALMVFDYGYTANWSFKTDVSTLIGGGEQRRSRWTEKLRKFTLPYNNKSITNCIAMLQFFDEHKGQYESFLFFDSNSRMTWTIPLEYKIASGTSVTKIYLYDRYIKKTNLASFPTTYTTPSPDFTSDVIVTVDSISRTTGMTLDPDEGSISFTSDYPTTASAINVTYENYIPVRFATDNMDLSEVNYNLGNFSIQLVEVK